VVAADAVGVGVGDGGRTRVDRCAAVLDARR